MQYIGEYIINNANNLEKDLKHSIMQNGAEMDMKDVVIYPDNVGMQRATLISFNYEGRKCEIGEHFGSQRDYFWVRIYA
jgi:hypothetical protein